ncbi:hypothetical protein G8B24_01550 [Limosilactobacillus reuteri]|uniref:hypothetical protein n=1 Tax=Limosilactobacillus reuteri TaxID=1598 RepID=UPI001F59FB46|nr:hypothetical protein [Limosilactobacillus reuteri]UNL39963.1 hypothetical protein G8B24_01550 [Limosilactobacillus reuteri]
MKFGYLSISINFARQIPMLNPTTGEIALFHALLDLKNIDMNFPSTTGKKKTWADGFDPTSATLQLYSGLSANGIVKAREKLKALGFIDFKSRGRRKSTIYKLLDLGSDKSAFNSSDNSVDISSDISGDNSSDNSSDNSVTLIKTKQDKTNTNNTSEKSQATPHEQKKKFSADSVEYRLAMYLFGKIKQNNPQHKDLTESQEQKWADHIRLMIERDNRTPQQIKNMIDWSQADSFWRQNILSTAKLRKQYDTMAPKANSEWQTQQPRKRVYE